MTRFSSAIALLLCLLLTLGSCRIHDCSPGADKVIYETVHANETYSYDLGFFGDEEGASITRQARHYAVSRVFRQQNFSKMVYEYEPEAGYLGTDEVEIRSERGWDGAHGNNERIHTVIKFRVIP